VDQRPGPADDRDPGRARAGTADDRGASAPVGFDLSRLRPHDELAPVVEYLTAIQQRRGEAASLLFVRTSDIDELAEVDGRPVPELLERLDQLGVVVSSN